MNNQKNKKVQVMTGSTLCPYGEYILKYINNWTRMQNIIRMSSSVHTNYIIAYEADQQLRHILSSLTAFEIHSYCS